MSKDGNLGVSAARSALLGSSGQMIKLVVNFASLILLSRILSPEDYGLTALAFALIGIAELIRDMGLSTASIQASKLSDQERSNLWWVNSGLGLACTLVSWAAAPLIVAIYGEPELLLIVMAMSTVFTLSGMATQYRVTLIRQLHYGRLSSWEVLCSLLAFISALVIALLGGGYWALVAQQVINNLLVLIGLQFMAGWFPQRYDRTVSIKKFFTFGLPLFGSSVLTYVGGNLDTALIGKYFGTATLGSYNRAIQMVRMPMNQIRNPLGNVALSTFSKVRDNKEAYRASVLKAQALYLYPIVFIAVWIALNSHDVILLLLGDKWEESISLVAILAIGDAITCLSSAAGWIYLSEAKSGALFKLTIFSTFLRIGLFILAIPYGVDAVAAVYGLTSLIMWPLTYIHCAKTTGFGTMAMFMVSLRVFCAVTAAALIAYFVGTLSFFNTHMILHLVAVSAIYGLAFLLVSLLIKPIRVELSFMFTMMLKVLKLDQKLPRRSSRKYTPRH